MIRDLERKVRKLEKNNQQLRDENEALSHQVSEAFQEALGEYESEIAGLRDELTSAESRADEAEALANQTTEKCSQLQVSLAAAKHEISTLNVNLKGQAELIVAHEEDDQRLADDIAALTTQLETMSEAESQLRNRIVELEEALQQTSEETANIRHRNHTLEEKLAQAHTKQQEVTQQHAQEAEKLRQQIRRVEKENQRLQMGLEASQEALRQFESGIAQLKSELAVTENRADKAEALANELAEKHSQMQASLTIAKQKVVALDQELQKRVEVIAAREEESRRLSADVTSLTTQLETMSETESQLRKRVAELEEALQQASSEAAKARQHNQLLDRSLAQIKAERQQTVKQLTRLTGRYEELRTEFAKAMAVLDSWGGKIAKWWATMYARDLPIWP